MRKRSSLMRRMVGLAIVALLIVLVLRSSDWQTRITAYLSYPFITAQHWFSEFKKHRADERVSRDLLVKQLHGMIAERDMLLRQLIERESTARYASDSCEVREFRSRFHLERGRIAQILLISQTPAAHFMFISSGSSSGIEPDMVVLANNALVGRVSAVYPHYSKVQLTTDKNCRVSAVCAKTGARGIHEGINNEKTTRLSFVSHFDKVEPGDLVVSQGAGLVFPRGFALGKVKSVATSGVFHVVEVEPVVDLAKVDFCLVVRRQDVDVEVCSPSDSGGELPSNANLPLTNSLPVSVVCPDVEEPSAPVLIQQPEQALAQAEEQFDRTNVKIEKEQPLNVQASLAVSPVQKSAPVSIEGDAKVVSDQVSQTEARSDN